MSDQSSMIVIFPYVKYWGLLVRYNEGQLISHQSTCSRVITTLTWLVQIWPNYAEDSCFIIAIGRALGTTPRALAVIKYALDESRQLDQFRGGDVDGRFVSASPGLNQ